MTILFNQGTIFTLCHLFYNTGRSLYFETISIDFFFVNDLPRSDDFHISLPHVHCRYCYNILSLNKQMSGNKTSNNIEGYVKYLLTE